MKQIQSDQSRKKFLALAFLLPFLGYSLVMLVSRFSPFGNSSSYTPTCITSITPSSWSSGGYFGPVALWCTTGAWGWASITWVSLPTIWPPP